MQHYYTCICDRITIKDLFNETVSVFFISQRKFLDFVICDVSSYQNVFSWFFIRHFQRSSKFSVWKKAYLFTSWRKLLGLQQHCEFQTCILAYPVTLCVFYIVIFHLDLACDAQMFSFGLSTSFARIWMNEWMNEWILRLRTILFVAWICCIKQIGKMAL